MGLSMFLVVLKLYIAIGSDIEWVFFVGLDVCVCLVIVFNASDGLVYFSSHVRLNVVGCPRELYTLLSHVPFNASNCLK